MSEKLEKSKEELVEDNILLLRKILQEALDFYTKQRSDIQFERREGSSVLDDDELDRKERFIIRRIAQYTDTKVALEQIIRSTAIEIPIDESLVEELITILVDKTQSAEYQANECTFVIRKFKERTKIREKLEQIFSEITAELEEKIRKYTRNTFNEIKLDGLEQVIKTRKIVEQLQYREFILEQYQNWIENSILENSIPLESLNNFLIQELIEKIELYQNEQTRIKVINKYFESKKIEIINRLETNHYAILDSDGPNPSDHIN